MSTPAVSKLTEASRQRLAEGRGWLRPWIQSSEQVTLLWSVEELFTQTLDLTLKMRRQVIQQSGNLYHRWEMCSIHTHIHVFHVFESRFTYHVYSFVCIIFLIIKSHQYSPNWWAPGRPGSFIPSAWEILIRSLYSLVSWRSALHLESETVCWIPPLRLFPQLSSLPTASLHGAI